MKPPRFPLRPACVPPASPGASAGVLPGVLPGVSSAGRPPWPWRLLAAVLAVLVAGYGFWNAGTISVEAGSVAGVSGAAPGTWLPAPLPRVAQRTPLLLCTTPARPGDTPAALFADPARFDCSHHTDRYGSGSFWLSLRPAGRGASLDLPLLGFYPDWQASASLSARRADGRVASIRLDNHTLSTFTGAGAAVIVPVPGGGERDGPDGTPVPAAAAHAPVVGLLLRIDGAINSRGLANGAQLLNDAAAAHDERVESLIYGLFAGLCMALLAYNVALWASIRERFQLAYCLSLAAKLLYIWSYAGGLELLFPGSDTTLHFRLNCVLLGIFAASALTFCVRFLEHGVVPPLLVTLLRAAMAALLVMAGAIALSPMALLPTLIGACTLLFATVPVFGVTMAGFALARSSRAVRVLLIAWGLPLVLVTLRLAQAMHLIGWSWLIGHAAVLAMGSEALLSSLAMTSRVKRLAQERDMARAEERVARRLADIDPLTGLLNRRALLDRVVDPARTGRQRLLLIDVDHFKAINDTLGHDTGDLVLRDLALLLGRRAAAAVSIARIGGEEFALIGPAETLNPALALTILADVRAHRFAGGHPVTVSIGMAEGTAASEAAWLDLYHRADAALYAAKGAGRNRVVDTPPAPSRIVPAIRNALGR